MNCCRPCPAPIASEEWIVVWIWLAIIVFSIIVSAYEDRT